MAALGNHCETMQQLLHTEAEVNAVDDQSNSSLMLAATRGNCAAMGMYR